MSGKEKTQPVLRPLASKGLVFDDKPLWNHVTVLSMGSGGGNRTWSCNYCGKKVTGSYSRVTAHLLRQPNKGVLVCGSIGDDEVAAIKKEQESADCRKAQQEQNARKVSEYVSLPSGSDLKQTKKKRKGVLETSFNVADRDIADKAAARMFYACGLPFNLARSPYYRKYIQIVANSRLAGYTPPSFDRLRTTLLKQEKEHINRLVQPIKDTWRKKGLSLVSDGWSDLHRRPLINIMAASSGGSMFLKSIDASGHMKDGEYVANLFLEAIKDVGESNVVQVITDNASNCKAAGMIVEEKFPHIFWTPCVVHSLNLALKSICDPPEKSHQYTQCKWVSDLVTQVHIIRNFIVNHNMSLFIFRSYSSLSLLNVAETRFASSIIMAKRLREVKKSLGKMVMDENWKAYRVDGNKTAENKAREVKLCVVDDTWWDKLDYFLSFTEPIIDMLRLADTDYPVLHLVYDLWDTMIENVKRIIFDYEHLDAITGKSSFFDAIHSILVARWNKSNTPLHCMAHSLVPRYYCDAWLQEGGNGVQRMSPHEDQEVSINRSKCFKRLFPNQSDLHQVYAEYGAFSSGSAYFSQPHVSEARMFQDSISWWANHGAYAPLLQSLAFKLLNQPASSSCCERNWSTYSVIQNVKRNKLATCRTEDLVFVHSNLRLLSRQDKEYKEGPTKYWDIFGDQLDIEGREVIELAALSLDEPVLEKISFDDGEGEIASMQQEDADE